MSEITRTASGGYLIASDLGSGFTRFTVEREGHKLVTFHGRTGEDRKCGAKCRNSVGPSCTCSCGGHAHGKDRW